MTKDLQDAQASIIAAIKRDADRNYPANIELYLHALDFLQDLEFGRVAFYSQEDEQYTGFTTKTSQTAH